MLERFEILAAAPEDVRGEEPSELHTELDVLSTEGSPIERVPEPKQRLHLLKARIVALGVVFGLQRNVARIER